MLLGLGQRFLFDAADYNEGQSYSRLANYQYLTFGMQSVYDLSYDWKLTTALQYNHFIVGKQRSDMTPVVVNKQRNGRGFEASVDIIKRGWYGSIRPFYRYWRVHNSDIVSHMDKGVEYEVKEPTNRTHEIGIRGSIYF